MVVLSGVERTGPPDGGPARVAGSRGWRMADRLTRRIGPANRRRRICRWSAQWRGLAKSVWQASYALANREQNLEGREGVAYAAPQGYSDCAKAGPRTQCVWGGWWRATGPVQVPNRKHPPFYPLRSDMREANTDAGHKGAWLCECGAAAWEQRHGARARREEAPARRAREAARVGGRHTKLGRLQ